MSAQLAGGTAATLTVTRYGGTNAFVHLQPLYRPSLTLATFNTVRHHRNHRFLRRAAEQRIL